MPRTEATRETVPIARWDALTFAGILAIALVLRLVGLNSSLWYGEVSPLARFIRLPVGEWITASASLKDHMFYLLQAKAAVAVFGEGAWSLRLPSFIFGLASIGVLWVMGRDAVGRTPALLAAFLLAIAYHHVWFSQDARGFTELLFWTSAATVLFVRGLRDPAGSFTVVRAMCCRRMYTNLGR
jgi:4-amino-4-deoxy-L-arabinose transferase-like glycosyltransferase